MLNIHVMYISCTVELLVIVSFYMKRVLVSHNKFMFMGVSYHDTIVRLLFFTLCPSEVYVRGIPRRMPPMYENTMT